MLKIQSIYTTHVRCKSVMTDDFEALGTVRMCASEDNTLVDNILFLAKPKRRDFDRCRSKRVKVIRSRV
ncbi:hypothetical protein HanHA89_Chr05g0202381 [Helianthus annuus]|nr:hypothetical protein HanHA89_Chr05g0202381 [Helianthus annuus]